VQGGATDPNISYSYLVPMMPSLGLGFLRRGEEMIVDYFAGKLFYELVIADGWG
jgi:hypothetical protein